MYVRGRPKGDDGLFLGDARDVGDVDSASFVTAVEAEEAEAGITSGGGNLEGDIAEREEVGALLASTQKRFGDGPRCWKKDEQCRKKSDSRACILYSENRLSQNQSQLSHDDLSLA